MPRRLPLLLALAIAILLPTARSASAWAPGEVLVKFKSGVPARDRAEIESASHSTLLTHFESLGIERLAIPSGSSVEAVVQSLRSDPRVEFAEPNYETRIAAVPNDPQFSQQWSLQNTGQTGGTPGADIHAPLAWDRTIGSQSLLIGVLDTGVEISHPDLAANIWVNLPEQSGGVGIDDDLNGYVDDVHGYDVVNNDGDPSDFNGHGTHVAGIIAARGSNGTGVVGVCWNASIVAIRILNDRGVGTVAQAIAGLQYAKAIGVRVANLSWSVEQPSAALLQALQDAGAAGMVIVAAAGNGGLNDDVQPYYPASYRLPYMISVAATDAKDRLAPYSNYGPASVDIAAPGTAILSTWLSGTYKTLTGTSEAAPIVSGACGLLLARFPSLANTAVKRAVLHSAETLPSLTGRVASGARLDAHLLVLDPDSSPPRVRDRTTCCCAGPRPATTARWDRPPATTCATRPPRSRPETSPPRPRPRR
jgi:subtilisin family serine protease